MLGWFRRRRERRALTESEADRLLSVHGKEAWGVIYNRSRDRTRSDRDREEAYRVRRVIEKRLGLPARVDTATRFLER